MNAAAAADAEIFQRIAELKSAWAKFEHADDVPEDILGEHLERNYNAPERELRRMRAATVSGVLAKLQFFKWDAKVSASDDPFRRGLESAIADLRGIVAAEGKS